MCRVKIWLSVLYSECLQTLPAAVRVSNCNRSVFYNILLQVPTDLHSGECLLRLIFLRQGEGFFTGRWWYLKMILPASCGWTFTILFFKWRSRLAVRLKFFSVCHLVFVWTWASNLCIISLVFFPYNGFVVNKFKKLVMRWDKREALRVDLQKYGWMPPLASFFPGILAGFQAYGIVVWSRWEPGRSFPSLRYIHIYSNGKEVF